MGTHNALHHDTEDSPEFAAYIGIDWSERKHCEFRKI